MQDTSPNAVFRLIEKYPKTFLIIVSSLLFLPLLGSYPLLGQWETHYGRVVMEMVANKAGIWDWWLDPIYLGQYNFWSKPIFCFWMVIPFYELLGPSEWAIRLPFALNGIFGIVLTYYIFDRLYHDRARAIVAALILIFTPYYYLITKQFMWDITAVVFIFGCVMFLFIGMRDNDRKLIRWAYVFAGLAMLTKGLLAIVIPGGIFFLWMLVSTDYSKFDEKRGAATIFRQYWDFLKKARVIEGLAIFLLVSGWWYIYMYAKHGYPFIREFFGEHHFGRIEGTIDKPDGPVEFYFWQMAIGMFPWIGFFVPALLYVSLDRKRLKEEVFVILSIFFIFLFFTVSATKFPHYIFPLVPFCAGILALPFIELYSGRRKALYPLTAILAALIIGVVAKDLGTGMNYRELLYIITTHRVQTWFGRVYDMLPWLTVLVPPMIFFILLPLVFLKSKKIMKLGLIGFFITSVVFAGYINFYFVPKVLWVFTPKQLVEKYEELKQPGDLIIGFDNWKDRCMYYYLGMNDTFERFNSPQEIANLIAAHPDNTIYITTKINKVPELRATILKELGVPLVNIMDDSVDTYKEIALLKASMKDKGKIDDNWKRHLISEAQIPSNITKVGGTLGGGSIEIIGYKLNKSVFDPEDELSISVYYKVLKEIKKNYMVFFHFDVYDGALPNSFKIDEYPMEGFYPTDKWKPGDILVDEFTTDVPPGHPGGGIKIYTGFYMGNDRMDVDQPKFNDGQNRFILGTFYVNIR